MKVYELLESAARETRAGLVVDAADRRLDAPCSGATYDSRKVGRGSVFVALPGQKADGAAFAPQAIAAGAVAVISEQPAPADVTAPWIVVPNARLALAYVAAAFFGDPSRPIVEAMGIPSSMCVA